MERSNGVTLGRVAATARVLHRLRLPISVVGIVAAAWFAWALIDTSVTSTRALVPLAILLWALLALGVGSMLTRLPPPVESGDPFYRRLKKHLLRLAYYFAIIVMLALIAMTLFLSYRAWQLA